MIHGFSKPARFFAVASGLLAVASTSLLSSSLLAQETSDPNDAAQNATALEGEPKRCIPADRIIGYKVESDDLVRFEMKGRKDVLVHLKRTCPQLHYHNYIAFQPTNGELCARFDDIISRAGLPCRIDSFTEVNRPKTGDKAPEDSRP